MLANAPMWEGSDLALTRWAYSACGAKSTPVGGMGWTTEMVLRLLERHRQASGTAGIVTNYPLHLHDLSVSVQGALAPLVASFRTKGLILTGVAGSG